MLEDTSDHMLWLGKKLVTGDEPIDAKEVLRRVKKVTIKDILELSKRLFRKEGLNVAVIGPTKDKDKEIIKEAAEGL
jgi:predicted Zn-dependent peptidase